VDVRNVVTAHLLAMKHAAAAGNRYILVSAAKAARELGWTARPARQSIIDAADSLIEQGVVRARAAARTARNATAAHGASPN
jgi:hypothetical protein